MKLYEITLHALSGFSAPIKGDTLFGHFCWQAVNDPSVINDDAETLFKKYTQKPFIVFSSAFPKLSDPSQYALKKPDLPAFMLFGDQAADCHEQQKQAKTRKQKRWLPVNVGAALKFIRAGRCGAAELLTDGELLARIARNVPAATRRRRRQAGEQFIKTLIQPHNTICRLTDTTGKGIFAPYAHRNLFYYPETELAVLVLIDADATEISKVRNALERIGQWGYGRDASSGLGRFRVKDVRPLDYPAYEDADALYALAPVVPEPNSFKQAWFTPFIRFGKHGDRFALSRNPFKTPVIMADEGAVFKPSHPSAFANPYFGQAVTGVSRHQGTLVQGYAPVLPLKLEGYDEN